MTCIYWRVPALFNNDRAALRLTQLLRPYLGRNLFDAVYGAPMTAWSGGRPSLVSEKPEEDLLYRYFEAYRAEGIRCSLTLTRMNLSKIEASLRELAERGLDEGKRPARYVFWPKGLPINECGKTDRKKLESCR